MNRQWLQEGVISDIEARVQRKKNVHDTEGDLNNVRCSIYRWLEVPRTSVLDAGVMRYCRWPPLIARWPMQTCKARSAAPR